MITILSTKDVPLSPNKDLIEYCGLSTDEKPTGLLVTGSTFLEVDTGDLYIYSEEGSEWLKLLSIKGESDN